MPKQFRTHYDNLKVARDAPKDVIAAAYRALSKRLHPDVNRIDPKAAESAMRIVNQAYEILSDPIKRKSHDDWIANQESSSAAPNQSETDVPVTQPHLSTSRMEPIIEHLSRTWGWYLILGGLAVSTMLDFGSRPSPSGLPTYDPSPASDTGVQASAVASEGTAFTRPAKAPNGSDWPSRAAYIQGYSIARADGLSKLTIDNASNSTDMFVKLVALDSTRTSPIRHAYIPAYQSFTMNDIRVGRYDVRYMDLTSGALSRSEEFELQEIPNAGGVQYSVTKMTLYKIDNGNMQTYSLDPSEF
jgi:curved DNA-binding protein CbpA